jgi:hypothetical protein
VSGITTALNGSPHVAQLLGAGAGVGFRQRGQTAGCIRLPDPEKISFETTKGGVRTKDAMGAATEVSFGRERTLLKVRR